MLPPDHVHLGWSSYAAQWLSSVPTRIPDHIAARCSTNAAARAEFERQGVQDWEAFLSFRAKELRFGGRLVIVLPALDDDGRSGFEDLMNHANEVLAEMVDDGTIKADERSRMVVAAYPRRRRDLLAPFERDGRFQHLVVEHCELSVLSDAAWADYERDQNKDVLASRYARFFRSTFAPSLILGLTHVGDAEERRSFADRLEDGLKRRFTSRPAPLNSFVQTIVLAKQ